MKTIGLLALILPGLTVGCGKKNPETPAAPSAPRPSRFADALEVALGRPLSDAERTRVDQAVERGNAEGTGSSVREFEGFAEMKDSRGEDRERSRRSALEWLQLRIAGDGGLDPWQTVAPLLTERPVASTDPDPERRETPSVGHPIVGGWSSSSFGMNWVDPALDPTGLNLADAHTGTSWRFNEDGSFSRVCIARGQFINGATSQKGRYRVEGDVVILTEMTQSWYPAPKDAQKRPAYRDRPSPDETHRFAVDPNGQALRIEEVMAGNFESYRRVN